MSGTDGASDNRAEIIQGYRNRLINLLHSQFSLAGYSTPQIAATVESILLIFKDNLIQPMVEVITVTTYRCYSCKEQFSADPPNYPKTHCDDCSKDLGIN